MLLFDLLAERRIEVARDAGLIDNLTGAGAPVPDDNLEGVPAEYRAAWRILRTAGFVPQEVLWHKAAQALALQLAGADSASYPALLHRLACINRCLEQAGKPALRVPPDYAQRLMEPRA